MSIDVSGLGDLSTADKLRIITALWDEIANSSEPIVMPDDILEEASRRNAEIAQDPAIVIDDAELWQRVND